MKISRNWLQAFFDAPLPEAEALANALTFHAFEIESVEKHQDDDVLDVKVTPNRGHDCLSHLGIARELSAILKLPLKTEYYGVTKPVILKPTTGEIVVTIEDTALCKRYVAGYIRGVKVGPSPVWLKKRLEAVGQRSINNVVDASNYVMLHMGQPSHAFDAEKLSEKSIQVRKALKGERMVALDDKEYVFTDSMLVIASGEKSVGIAGVKGGKETQVTESTTELLLEAANFDGVSVRKTARALNLRTDASQRFEQGMSADMVARGMRAVIDLILEVAGGELVECVDVYPHKVEEQTVSFSTAHTNALLGTALSDVHIEEVLARLAFTFEKKGNSYSVAVSPERLDLLIAEDMIEEVGRIVGYDAVPEVELPSDIQAQVNARFAASEMIREDYVARGYSEVITSVFANAGERAVSNKIGGDKPYLRTTLVDGLREAYERNQHNKDLLELDEVKLFEIGVVWKQGKEEWVLGVADKTGVREEPMALSEHASYQVFPGSTTTRYQPFSKYPYIVRDVALWCPKDVSAEQVSSLIREHAGELLVRTPRLFDRFEKGDRVSFAFRLVFQSFDRTLFDEDANRRMESIYTALKNQGYEIR